MNREQKKNKRFIAIFSVLYILDMAEKYLTRNEICKIIKNMKISIQKSDVIFALKELKLTKLVGSSKGRNGGYYLLDNLQGVNLEDLLEIMFFNNKKLKNKILVNVDKEISFLKGKKNIKELIENFENN